jgi:hypothetical protein
MTRSDWGKQPGAFAQPGTAETTPQQTKADAAIAKIVAPETQQLTGNVGDVFKAYEDKLDDESRDELQKIIATGDPIRLNAALKRLRDKYGYVR